MRKLIHAIDSYLASSNPGRTDSDNEQVVVLGGKVDHEQLARELTVAEQTFVKDIRRLAGRSDLVFAIATVIAAIIAVLSAVNWGTQGAITTVGLSGFLVWIGREWRKKMILDLLLVLISAAGTDATERRRILEVLRAYI